MTAAIVKEAGILRCIAGDGGAEAFGKKTGVVLRARVIVITTLTITLLATGWWWPGTIVMAAIVINFVAVITFFDACIRTALARRLRTDKAIAAAGAQANTALTVTA